MFLQRVRVTKYRSIRDSGWFDVEKGKTILIGPNEAGKTALLEAVQRINPPLERVGSIHSAIIRAPSLTTSAAAKSFPATSRWWKRTSGSTRKTRKRLSPSSANAATSSAENSTTTS